MIFEQFFKRLFGRNGKHEVNTPLEVTITETPQKTEEEILAERTHLLYEWRKAAGQIFYLNGDHNRIKYDMLARRYKGARVDFVKKWEEKKNREYPEAESFFSWVRNNTDTIEISELDEHYQRARDNYELSPVRREIRRIHVRTLYGFVEDDNNGVTAEDDAVAVEA